MPAAVIVIVGGPDGAGGGAGVLTGGVGAVGVMVDAPLEHAATAINGTTMKADRNTASPLVLRSGEAVTREGGSMPEGAPDSSVTILTLNRRPLTLNCCAGS
jgi:hypothetical protein